MIYIYTGLGPSFPPSNVLLFDKSVIRGKANLMKKKRALLVYKLAEYSKSLLFSLEFNIYKIRMIFNLKQKN